MGDTLEYRERTHDGIVPPPFSADDFAIDDLREMKVIAIGAGMSGILAGIRSVKYNCSRIPHD